MARRPRYMKEKPAVEESGAEAFDVTNEEVGEGIVDKKETDEDILQEARDNFKLAHDYESDFRKLYIEDVKFANGDSDNGWQWPHALLQDREVNKRPALTVNKVTNEVGKVTNYSRQNPSSIRIKPVGGQSSFDASQAFEGLVRDIEYQSNAQSIYEEATDSQVEGGIGYWRVLPQYANDDSFDQELRILPVWNHLGVLLDPNIKQRDGSDAMWGFIFDEVQRSRAEKQYPDIDFRIASNTLGVDGNDDWITDDAVRIAEYFRIKEIPDELIFIDDGNEQAQFRRSDIPEKWRGLLPAAEKNPDITIKRRKLMVRKLQWFKIVGADIVSRRWDFKCQYIPIIRVPGRERKIEGKLERKGLVRSLKDPQRMYNYNTSGQVEYGALATKSPWVGPLEAFEGNEVQWNNANTNNAAYLTYKHRDSEGETMPKPERPEPPGTSPAFLDGMRIAAAEIEMASGQFGPQQHNPAMERTPRAVSERRRQGDIATFDFLNNLAAAKAYTGRIIIDWARAIYDTERVVQILNKDGTRTSLKIDPEAQTAYEQAKSEDEVAAIFNPRVGRYEVRSDIGPSYATQREEAWNAFVEIMTGDPVLINEIGDLMFKAADFPMADEISERLRRKIRQASPWLLDEAINPLVQQLQQQLKMLQEQSQQAIAELLQKLGESRLKLIGKDNRYDIEAYDAETKRLKDLANAQPELDALGKSEALKPLIQQILSDMANAPNIVNSVNAEQENEPPPAPGTDEPHAELMKSARQAPDGNWYVKDPRRPGKYMRVREDAAA